MSGCGGRGCWSANCKWTKGGRVAGNPNLAGGAGRCQDSTIPQLQRRPKLPALCRGQSQRRASPVAASRATSSSTARASAGAAAAYPSVNRSATASSRTSTARGGSGPGGAARPASAASRTPPSRLPDHQLVALADPDRLQVRLAGQARDQRAFSKPGRAGSSRARRCYGSGKRRSVRRKRSTSAVCHTSSGPEP